MTPLEIFTESASVLISHSLPLLFNKKVAVRVTKSLDSPNLFKQNTKIAEFSVVTPEQSKYIKLVDMAILSMIP